jgi:hypothetical protein
MSFTPMDEPQAHPLPVTPERSEASRQLFSPLNCGDASLHSAEGSADLFFRSAALRIAPYQTRKNKAKGKVQKAKGKG